MSHLTQERKKNWVPTSYLQEEDKIRCRVFLSYELLNSRKWRNFLYDELPTRAMEVRESQGSHWVRHGWSNATEESVGKSGREKKETKEGEKVAPAKATFRVTRTKNSLFWFTSSGVLRDPSRLKYQLLRYFFYKEAMCEGSSGNRLLNATKAVP
jgi:hypothetical protein